MRPLGHPSELSPEQRRSEPAGILATGVLRLRKLRLLTGEPTALQESAPKSFAEDLDVSAETVLSVHTR